MYLGRMVAIGQTNEGLNLAAYRLSSRSFPDRTAILSSDQSSVDIVQKDNSTISENQFITYRCVEVASNWLVVSNGSHTNPIAEQLRSGTSPKESLVNVLTELGYEHDDYATPRIAGIIPQRGSKGWLGVIRKDGLEVQEVELHRGQLRYVSTNEHFTLSPQQNIPCKFNQSAEIVTALLQSSEWLKFEHPVTAVACVAQENAFRISTGDWNVSS